MDLSRSSEIHAEKAQCQEVSEDIPSMLLESNSEEEPLKIISSVLVVMIRLSCNGRRHE